MTDNFKMDEECKLLSPPKKRQKKAHFSKSEKEMVLNTYKTEFQRNPEAAVTDVVEFVACATGVGKASVYRIMREYKSEGTLHSPKKKRSRHSITDNIDDFDRNAIRKKVHEFFSRNEIPTIHKVLTAVNEDSDLPTFKRTTFYFLIKELGFKHEKRGRNSCLIEKDDIILWRRRYLRTMKSMKQQGKKIYYLDETWLNAGHTLNKVWTDSAVTSSKKAFLSGLSTGLKAPSGKGERLIITHIGSDTGFLPDGLLIFKSNKNDDYHKDMNADCFENWFEKILQLLENDSVIVMDNAPYHSRKLEKIPNSSWKKENIIEWLNSKNISHEEGLLKTELLNLVKRNKDRYDKFSVDEMARCYNKTVLRLPPYHCELNPIELIWAQVKGFVARENKTFKLRDVEELCKKSVAEIGVNEWKKCIGYVEKIEKNMWDLDEAIETTVDKFVINVNSSDSDSLSSDCEL